MDQAATVDQGRRHRMEKRLSGRRPLVIPVRVTWKDSHGTTRFASAVTRDVSELGVYVQLRESSTIPLYRLVHLQIEREARDTEGLPTPLQSGRVLSAVYRVGAFQRSTGTPDGYALRLLVEPRSTTAAARRSTLDAAATA
jgi:hypothetical protein